uniref:Proliferation-associated SNF2-like protein n=1 Tax=Tetraodon nigroviridis TaxID=99883 RepID=H3C664_TETNG
ADSVNEENRSSSPHCPKPDEPEEPLGTAMETVTSLKASTKFETTEVVITKEMEEEEKQLMKERERKEQEIMAKAKESWGRDSHEMRYKRLQHLLQKSNIYSKFLLTKMEQQQNEEKIKKEKTEKRGQGLFAQLKNDAKLAKDKRKRKRNEDYKIADVMSKDEIMSRAKKTKVAEEEAQVSKKIEAEDIERSSDSNQDIKNRLSEAVRDNAKHLLDPYRKVNGEPVPAQQPQLFTGGVMRWYQIEGIEWLRMLWENGINGILADEMGLGKTIQCIAHIAMMIERKVMGPFLVVAPLSTLPNWISEFKRFTPEVSVLLYHGPQAERTRLLKQMRRPQGPLSMCPVVVTSFEIAMIDRKFLQRLQWKYLIVDEGHRIKNLNCRLVRELKRLPTDNKLLLTGTPLQNNLAELWSLLNFLLAYSPDAVRRKTQVKCVLSWPLVFSVTEESPFLFTVRSHLYSGNACSLCVNPVLQKVFKLGPSAMITSESFCCLFALGKQNISNAFKLHISNQKVNIQWGKKVLSQLPKVLPPKMTEKRHLITAPNSQTPNTTMAKTKELSKDTRNKIVNLHTAGKSESTIVLQVQSPLDSQINMKLQNIIMLLKRCCNHPYLVEYPLDRATQEFKIDEQLVQSSGKFLILDRMLPALKRRGHKVLIFSQMTSILDILMDYCFLRGFQYSRLDGSMTFADREENITKFSKDPQVFLFLLSTRAGGLGINLTAADTVIIFDSDWNPQADLQAQDRCHRIGQTKPVVVYRLVTANTIDQKILERASNKRKLEQMVIHKNKFKGGKSELNQSKGGIDLNELMELLKTRRSECEMTVSKGKVISDKDLEILLDRTDLLEKAKSTKQEKFGVFKIINTDESSEIRLT